MHAGSGAIRLQQIIEKLQEIKTHFAKTRPELAELILIPEDIGESTTPRVNMITLVYSPALKILLMHLKIEFDLVVYSVPPYVRAGIKKDEVMIRTKKDYPIDSLLRAIEVELEAVLSTRARLNQLIELPQHSTILPITITALPVTPKQLKKMRDSGVAPWFLEAVSKGEHLCIEKDQSGSEVGVDIERMLKEQGIPCQKSPEGALIVASAESSPEVNSVLKRLGFICRSAEAGERQLPYRFETLEALHNTLVQFVSAMISDIKAMERLNKDEKHRVISMLTTEPVINAHGYYFPSNPFISGFLDAMHISYMPYANIYTDKKSGQASIKYHLGVSPRSLAKHYISEEPHLLTARSFLDEALGKLIRAAQYQAVLGRQDDKRWLMSSINEEGPIVISFQPVPGVMLKKASVEVGLQRLLNDGMHFCIYTPELKLESRIEEVLMAAGIRDFLKFKTKRAIDFVIPCPPGFIMALGLPRTERVRGMAEEYFALLKNISIRLGVTSTSETSGEASASSVSVGSAASHGATTPVGPLLAAAQAGAARDSEAGPDSATP